jgi:putative transposase
VAIDVRNENRLLSGIHSRGNLPHLKREGGTYFVTFRLKGTLPVETLLRFKQEREVIIQKALAAGRPLTWVEQNELFRWYSERVDSYLDLGKGECLLANAPVAEIVAKALKFFDGDRYSLGEWVIMPNHVHVIVRPLGNVSLSEVLQSWKGFTAREINRLLKRTGAVWQTESYDHLIRDDEDRIRCARYVRENPQKAGLCAAAAEWKYGSGFCIQ